MYLVLAVIILFFTMTTDTFLTSKNILNICRQISMIGICSVGMTMVLLTGGIDISVGSIIALVGVVSAKLIGESGMPIFPAMVIGIAVGAFCGLIDGIMVAKFDVPALITTLAMQTMARGAAYILTSGIPIYGLPEGIKTLGQDIFSKFPYQSLSWLLFSYLAGGFLNRHVLGDIPMQLEEIKRLQGFRVLMC